MKSGGGSPCLENGTGDLPFPELKFYTNFFVKAIKGILKKLAMDSKALFDRIPVEIWAKILNYLPYICVYEDNITCELSLVCKKFEEICQSESLVPVKDLCIYGDKKHQGFWTARPSYGLRDFESVAEIIIRSKKLTALKFKSVNLETANALLRIAFHACPKLTHVEIEEISDMYPTVYSK